MSCRGRYAPSPTGELHVGNASSALLSWLSIRAQGGSYVMRVEDLDRGRSREEFVSANLEDLRWLGMDWDEGPQPGEPTPEGPVSFFQSERGQAYQDAIRSLRSAGCVFPCFCSRRDLRAAAGAPQEPGEEPHYPGTCAALSAAESTARIEAGAAHAWRFRVDPDAIKPIEDWVYGRYTPRSFGDFLVGRRGGEAAYQLAVVVDDAAMGITEVVRGDDLLESAARQELLYRALDLPIPRWGHVPLLMGADGARLSKRHQGIALRELREAGWSPERLVGELAACWGLRSSAAPVEARELIDEFRWEKIAPRPEGILWNTVP